MSSCHFTMHQVRRHDFEDTQTAESLEALPNLDGDFEFEEDSRQPSPVVDLSQEPAVVGPELDAPFDTEDAVNLRRVIGDMCAATPPVLSATIPWELPGINLVIGDDTPTVPTPVLHPVPILEVEPPSKQESHRTARVHRIRGSFHEVIDFKLTLADSEILSSRWDRALEKCYLIFAGGGSAWPRGMTSMTQLQEKVLLACDQCSAAEARTLCWRGPIRS